MKTLDKAEFDSFAQEYESLLGDAVKISGEQPDFFAEYKIADVADVARLQSPKVQHILDFGSGVGNSLPWFRKYFPDGELTCADVSAKSMEIARRRFPGPEIYAQISGERLPMPDGFFDLVFTACVFHHIPPAEHVHWFEELRRVTKPNGLFVIFEHNPWNPLTVRLVNNCPLDVNAILMSAPALRASLKAAKWRIDDCRYRLFFPKSLAALRPLEKYLTKIALGAQYFVVGRNMPSTVNPVL